MAGKTRNDISVLQPLGRKFFEIVAARWKMAIYKLVPQRFFIFRRKNLLLKSGVRGAAPAEF